jgi:polyisoprenoid-binding protein YceI
MRYAHLTAVFLIALFFCGSSEAKEWKIDPSSRLTFTGSQGGEAFHGSFSSFHAKVDFDPAHPETSRIDVTIDMASAKTGDKQRDESLPLKDWFDSKNFPQAEFHASEVQKLSDTQFEAKGKLTIKSITKDVVLPFTLKPERDVTRAQGELVIDRTAFNVGTGEWLSEELVGHKVTIGVDLVAN